MNQTTEALVREQVELTRDIFRMDLDAPRASREAVPGQFLALLPGIRTDLILRRPISICRADPSLGTITLVYQVKGAGTKALSRLTAGDTVDFIGPLGRGFSITGQAEHLLVIGGGIGIFPLLHLLEVYAREHPRVARHACLGFKTRDQVVLENEFQAATGGPASLVITTEDGTYGEKGFVTCPSRRILEQWGRSVRVCACGPKPMLKAAAEMALGAEAACELSLEERMGCGIGACLVCACKMKAKNGEQDWVYGHVCKDGPVFPAEEVLKWLI